MARTIDRSRATWDMLLFDEGVLTKREANSIIRYLAIYHQDKSEKELKAITVGYFHKIYNPNLFDKMRYTGKVQMAGLKKLFVACVENADKKLPGAEYHIKNMKGDATFDSWVNIGVKLGFIEQKIT